jgi:hypothetical protein
LRSGIQIQDLEILFQIEPIKGWIPVPATQLGNLQCKIDFGVLYG